MAVEDHPKFPEWKKRLEDLLDAIESMKAGTGAQQIDVDNARAEYDKIVDEL